jgi:hypothetical protein
MIENGARRADVEEGSGGSWGLTRIAGYEAVAGLGGGTAPHKLEGSSLVLRAVPGRAALPEYVLGMSCARTDASARTKKTPPERGFLEEPSVGLEPTTPSLPWKCSTS